MDKKTICLLGFGFEASLGDTSLVEGNLATSPDLLDALHGVEGGGNELSVVAEGYVAFLLELERRVESHLLAVGLAESFCPANLSRIALQLEVLVAFRLAELEHFGIVTNECDPLAWVARSRAEEAVFDPHPSRFDQAELMAKCESH